MGIDFCSREVVLPGNMHVALQLWEIGGQSIGSKIISQSFCLKAVDFMHLAFAKHENMCVLRVVQAGQLGWLHFLADGGDLAGVVPPKSELESAAASETAGLNVVFPSPSLF